MSRKDLRHAKAYRKGNFSQKLIRSKVPLSIVLSCEHATNEIPQPLRPLFRGAGPIMRTHRAWDIGALEYALNMQRALRQTWFPGLDIPIFVASTSRLVIDLNRSPGHRYLFSEFTKRLSPTQKDQILTSYYRPYRDAVTNEIESLLKIADHCLHLSLHSFTPILNGEDRRCDIGILYAPSRALESRFARTLKASLNDHASSLVVRSNYPYQGTADGFTTFLRRKFPASRYIGVEIEVSQARLAPIASDENVMTLSDALSAAIANAATTLSRTSMRVLRQKKEASNTQMSMPHIHYR